MSQAGNDTVTLLWGGRVVTSDGLLDPGVVTVERGRLTAVAACGRGSAVPTGAVDLRGRLIVPGFVDLHVHGGAGADFTTASPEEARRAVAFHRRHGSTAMLASVATAPLPTMVEALSGLAPLVADGTLVGAHIEGPFLNPRRRGAHDAAQLRAPDRSGLAQLLRTDVVRMVTLAPELQGSAELMRALVDADVIVALGHSDAGYQEAHAAIAAGATVVTHLWNGMAPLHHRRPGLIAAAMESPDVIVELIADGHHIHDSVLALTARLVGATRVALITDAIAATGEPDGSYMVSGTAVTVRKGVARTADGRALAGSTLTMDAAVRHAVGAGISLVDAVHMAATTPARLLGLEAGALTAGAPADLVVLDHDLAVEQVMVGGAWLSPQDLRGPQDPMGAPAGPA